MDRVFSQCIMGVSALLTKCEQDDTSQVPRRQSIVSILMPLLLESHAFVSDRGGDCHDK